MGKKEGKANLDLTFDQNRRTQTDLCPPQLLISLQDWIKESGRAKGLVFSENGFTPVPYRSVQHHYNAAFETLGLKWRSTHIMRHSFATDFLQATGDQHALKGLLGHKHLEQTEHYAKNTQNVIVNGMKAYGESFQSGSIIVPLRESLK